MGGEDLADEVRAGVGCTASIRIHFVVSARCLVLSSLMVTCFDGVSCAAGAHAAITSWNHHCQEAGGQPLWQISALACQQLPGPLSHCHYQRLWLHSGSLRAPPRMGLTNALSHRPTEGVGMVLQYNPFGHTAMMVPHSRPSITVS